MSDREYTDKRRKLMAYMDDKRKAAPSAPERLWAWCFQPNADGTWSGWGGYARPENCHALDETERLTGAEYIRKDLSITHTEADALVADALQRAAKKASEGEYPFDTDVWLASTKKEMTAHVARAISSAILAMIQPEQFAALTRIRDEARAVKPLDWGSRWWTWSSLGDLYELQQLSTNVIQVLKNGTALPGWETHATAAQAAAQADYEARVHSTLVATKQENEG